jgi:hypothetical protein
VVGPQGLAGAPTRPSIRLSSEASGFFKALLILYHDPFQNGGIGQYDCLPTADNWLQATPPATGTTPTPDTTRNSNDARDNRIVLCDISARVAFKVYGEKLSGISYQGALDAIDDRDQQKQLNQLFPGHTEGINQLTTLLKLILQIAYTSSWSSAQEFSEHEREICLADN